MRSLGLWIYIETKLQIIYFMIFEKRYFSYDILLTDQTSLSDCLYVVGYVYCNCALTSLERHEINLIFLIFLFFLVLEQLPSKKIPPPNPKTNPNLTPNPYQLGGGGEKFSSVAIAWLPLDPKTNPNVEPNPNTNREDNFPRGQLSGYCFSYRKKTKTQI